MKFRNDDCIVCVGTSDHFWDPNLSCLWKFPTHQYFDHARLFSARPENAREHLISTKQDVSSIITLAQERNESVMFIPDKDVRRLIAFSPVLSPADPDCGTKAIALVTDLFSGSKQVSWCTSFRLTQFAYLAKPEKSRELMRGVVEALAALGNSGTRSRWLLDIDSRALDMFIPMLQSSGFRNVSEPHGSDDEPIDLIQRAVQEGNAQSLESILKRKCNLDVISDKWLSPLMHACLMKQTEFCRMMIDSGAEVDFESPIGRSALSVAAATGAVDICGFLLKAGANIESRSTRAETPLMFAADSGQLDSVRFLLHAGANRESRNTAGKTAFDFAEDRGFSEITALLSAG